MRLRSLAASEAPILTGIARSSCGWWNSRAHCLARRLQKCRKGKTRGTVRRWWLLRPLDHETERSRYFAAEPSSVGEKLCVHSAQVDHERVLRGGVDDKVYRF